MEMEISNESYFGKDILFDLNEDSLDDENHLKCRLCFKLFVKPKFLSCTHSFCEECLNKLTKNNKKTNLISIQCPTCRFITEISDVESLIDDNVLNREVENNLLLNSLIKCGQCSSCCDGGIAHCLICSSYLCSNCCEAHKYMKCFSTHELRYLTSDTNQNNSTQEKDFQLIKLDFQEKLNKINLNKQNILENLDQKLNSLQIDSNKMKKEIEKTFNKYQQILNDVYEEYLLSLNHFQHQQQIYLIQKSETIQKGSQQFQYSQTVFNRCLNKCSQQEFIHLKKHLFDQKLNQFQQLFTTDDQQQLNNTIQFQITPIKQFQRIIKDNFGQIISTPTDKKDCLLSLSNGENDSKSSGFVLSEISSNGEYKCNEGEEEEEEEEFESIFNNCSTNLHQNVQNNLEELFQINQKMNSNSYPSLAPPLVDVSPSNEYPPPSFVSTTYSSRDSSLSRNGVNSRSPTPYSNVNVNVNVNVNERCLIRGGVQPMQVRCKFGSLGPQKSQFNAPHGFCLGIDEEIIVADTNNHRISIFDKMGEYKYQFGIPGREEGQLWYPRKVSIIRQTGKFVICDRGNERSRMQIFKSNGEFIKKISIRYIDILAGLAITPQGNIVAVDSVSPTVFCLNESGDLLKWFDCSDYMREPSDIAVFDNQYFVCDFKGHCVVVFDSEGIFLRRIGSEHLTHFPNGIDISDAGDVIIGDSHGNRFHLSVFTRTGDFLQEYDCPYIKVSRCCGLKITSDGFIVTLAKNNHHVLVLNTLYLT